MFLNKFIYFALYQKHLLKVSTSCLSKDGDNIITKILQKSGIQKNEVIELIYRGFI